MKTMNNFEFQRRKKGLSQKELADKVGCHVNTINNIERGTNSPRTELLKKISEILNCTIDNLID